MLRLESCTPEEGRERNPVQDRFREIAWEFDEVVYKRCWKKKKKQEKNESLTETLNKWVVLQADFEMASYLYGEIKIMTIGIMTVTMSKEK